MNINWYPGHMKKTKELITENLKIIDLVIEILDARIPFSSKNPDISKLAKNKQPFCYPCILSKYIIYFL